VLRKVRDDSSHIIRQPKIIRQTCNRFVTYIWPRTFGVTPKIAHNKHSLIRACRHFQLNATLLCGVGRCVDAHADQHRVCHAWGRPTRHRARPGRQNHSMPRLLQAFQDLSCRTPAPRSNGEIIQVLQGPAPSHPKWLGQRRRARGRTGGEPQSRRPAARYDGLGHRLKRSTQSAPDGPGRTACAGGLAGGLGRRPRAC
jgi:hypothetical protein